MLYTSAYISPLGKLVMEGDTSGLTGLWFEGQKYFPEKLCPEKELPVFAAARKWLDIYFSGNEPKFNVPIHFTGSGFQKEVWELLCRIPYGKTVTYGELAKILAEKRGIPRMSAQAVGGAVGHNRISIIVPCHRVIGSDGSLTGYAGGIERKAKLLRLESPLYLY